ncbi:hypothetical protein [Polaromonas sp. C04]|uniref:hypothetical protein n=1 Tax=Polaromonas sp. C04 TaxID=1945857 RepID=UPI001186627D|nr:hypothetical protein [Polaromonas sp. C04]
MFKRILVFVCFCFVFSGTCLAGEKAWYPKATDSCASFNAERGTALWRDSRILNLKSGIEATLSKVASDVAAFEGVAPAKDDKRVDDVTATILLSAYCDNHGSMKLGDVNPSEVVMGATGDLNNPANESNMAIIYWYQNNIGLCGSDVECLRIASSYKAHARLCNTGNHHQACTDLKRDRKKWDLRKSVLSVSSNDSALNQWVTQSLAWCGTNADCTTIVKSYQAHAISCAAGSKQACIDKDRDLKDWTAIGANSPSNPQTASKGSMMQCLQDALKKAVENCRQQNCPNEVIPQVVRVAQQAQCGYSAIEAEKPIYPVRPQLPAISNCTSTPMVGGGFTTDCTQD